MITSQWPTNANPANGIFVSRQVDSLRKAGVQVDVISFRGGINLLNYLRAWWRVHRCLAEKHYDLVHAQFGQNSLPAVPKQLPLVITFRGSDLIGIVGEGGHYVLAGYILRVIGKIVSRFADEIIVVSDILASYLPGRSVHIIPNGINLDLFSPMPQTEARQVLNLPLNKKLILFAADPENPVKRFDLAQKALDQLDKTRYDVELIVTRGIAAQKMPLYMNACDVLLLTSYHEGSPGVVKEALACNLPVVSVDVGDVKKRIESTNGCVVCPSDEPKIIATGLRQVLDNPCRIDGRAAIRDLNEELIAQRIIAVYERALNPHA